VLSWIFKKKKKLALPRDLMKRVDADAIEILGQLQRAGFESYLVGGCVRDILIGKIPKDFDMATRATPQQVKAIVKRSFIIGKRFRIVVAKRNVSRSEAQHLLKNDFPTVNKRPPEKEFQITTFRRAPVVVLGAVNENVFGNPEEDAYRRDFTVNGLFLDPFSAKIVDFVGGLADLEKKTLRIIGDPKIRFEEDPIRILRALRFVARTELQLEAATEKALIACIPTLKTAKKERLREEILKALKEGSAPKFFDLMSEYKIWALLSPHFHEAVWSVERHRRLLLKLSEASSKQPWQDSLQAGPLFFVLLAPLLFENMHAHIKETRGSMKILQEDFKLSKKEIEDLERIVGFLKKVDKDLSHGGSSAKDHRLFFDNPRFLNLQSQCFYVLKICADAGLDSAKKAWKELEDPWREHVQSVALRAVRQARRPSHGGHHGGGHGRRRGSGGGSRGASASAAGPASSSGRSGSGSSDGPDT